VTSGPDGGTAPELVLRRATEADAAAVADVYLASFKATYDFPLAHTDDEVRGWIAETVVPQGETWVAEEGRRIVAMMTLDERGIDQLYVVPDRLGKGIGSALVEIAKRRRPAGLELYTFQVNRRARTFYKRHGFAIAATGDGSGNEEHQPDLLFRWRPAAPARR
jgi:GNAT superfamily N-acetyltransferase